MLPSILRRFRFLNLKPIRAEKGLDIDPGIAELEQPKEVSNKDNVTKRKDGVDEEEVEEKEQFQDKAEPGGRNTSEDGDGGPEGRQVLRVKCETESSESSISSEECFVMRQVRERMVEDGLIQDSSSDDDFGAFREMNSDEGWWRSVRYDGWEWPGTGAWDVNDENTRDDEEGGLVNERVRIWIDGVAEVGREGSNEVEKVLCDGDDVLKALDSGEGIVLQTRNENDREETGGIFHGIGDWTLNSQ